jgi:hypothetical protein
MEKRELREVKRTSDRKIKASAWRNKSKRKKSKR